MNVETLMGMLDYLQTRISELDLQAIKAEVWGPNENGIGYANPSFTVKFDDGIIESQMTVWTIGPADIGAYDNTSNELILDEHVTINSIQEFDTHLKKILAFYT